MSIGVILRCSDILEAFHSDKICCPLCHRHGVNQYSNTILGYELFLCCITNTMLHEKIDELGEKAVIKLLNKNTFIVGDELI